MKIYYTCECCQRIHKTSEIEGPEGVIELQELCLDCLQEIGLLPGQDQSKPHFIN